MLLFIGGVLKLPISWGNRDVAYCIADLIHLELVSLKMQRFTTQTSPIHTFKTELTFHNTPILEIGCVCVCVDVDHWRQLYVQIVTSKHLPARHKRPESGWKGNLCLFWPLEVYADHSRLFQLLSQLVNVPCVWMRPAVFVCVCVCLVGAERPQ